MVRILALVSCLLAAPALGAEPQAEAKLAPLAASRYQAGVAYYRDGEFTKAAHEFETALAIAPRSAKLAYNLGRTLERLERYGDAALAYERYLQLASGAEDAESVRKLVEVLRERAPSSPELRLTAYLVCRRKSAEETYADVPDCHGAELTHGDQVKFGFEVDTRSHVYVYSHNDKGQVQVLFPGPGVANVALPGARHFLPAGDEWLELDAQGGTVEQVRVIAATRPVPELEALRSAAAGAGHPPDPRITERAEAYAASVSGRGFSRPKAPVRIGVGRGMALTLPVVQTGPRTAAVELRVVHK